MKDLNFDNTLDDIFRQELPYIMIGLSKYKTTKIVLPRVSDNDSCGSSRILYDRRTRSIHNPGNSSSIRLKYYLGFKDKIFIDENGFGYSFEPLFGHKHINQDLLIQFIDILKDYSEIRNRHINLFRGENYYFNYHGRQDLNDPFKNTLVIHKDKDIVFYHELNRSEYQMSKRIIRESGHSNLINSLYQSFESIADEYVALYKRVKDLASTYRLIEKL